MFAQRFFWCVMAALLIGPSVGCNFPVATPTPPIKQSSQVEQPTASLSVCREDEFSTIAVKSSTDQGASWTELGHICYHDASILSVDCTALPTDNGVALYFIDMKLLGQPSNIQRMLYRAISTDGVNFDSPVAVITSSYDMVDPAVIRTWDGKIRLYVPSGEVPMLQGFIGAVSEDGVHFTRDSSFVNANGGMPGGLVLPDHRVRMFAGGEIGPGQRGIVSMISDDGFHFTQESGLRIAAASPREEDVPGDPSPIHLLNGGYLMSFMVNPSNPRDAIKAEYRLATSQDGFSWKVNPSVFAVGGTSCLVQRSDGTLFFYYGTK